MKNQKENYTRENFINLLSEIFNGYEKNGYIEFEGKTQQEIASQLAIDSGQFSKFLNSTYNKSYETVIKRLEIAKELKQSKENQTKERWKLKALSLIVGLLIFGLLYQQYYNTPQTNISNKTTSNASLPQSYMMDVDDLDKVRELYGSNIRYQATLETVLTNIAIKEKSGLSNIDSISLINSLWTRLENIISKERDNLRKLNIVSNSNINVIDYIEAEMMDLDKIKKQYAEVSGIIISKSVSGQFLANQILDYMECTQGKSWKNILTMLKIPRSEWEATIDRSYTCRFGETDNTPSEQKK